MPSPSRAATGTSRCWPSRSSRADSTAVTACTVVRRSKVWAPRPPESRSANLLPISRRTRLWSPTFAPRTRDSESRRVRVIFSPPGTSPSPVRPSESFRTTMLRVKNGPWAPERFSSMQSRPATGWTEKWVTVGWFMLVGFLGCERERAGSRDAVPSEAGDVEGPLGRQDASEAEDREHGRVAGADLDRLDDREVEVLLEEPESRVVDVGEGDRSARHGEHHHLGVGAAPGEERQHHAGGGDHGHRRGAERDAQDGGDEPG